MISPRVRRRTSGLLHVFHVGAIRHEVHTRASPGRSRGAPVLVRELLVVRLCRTGTMWTRLLATEHRWRARDRKPDLPDGKHGSSSCCDGRRARCWYPRPQLIRGAMQPADVARDGNRRRRFLRSPGGTGTSARDTTTGSTASNCACRASGFQRARGLPAIPRGKTNRLVTNLARDTGRRAALQRGGRARQVARCSSRCAPPPQAPRALPRVHA